MSSVEEIAALREELEAKRRARQGAEVENVEAKRQAELDKEADRLRREIAEEDVVAQLLADAGQVVEKQEGRTDQEIILAAGAAIAIANGATQDEVNVALAEAKGTSETDDGKVVAVEAPKAEAPKLTGGRPTPNATATSTVNTGASKEEEK